MKAERVFEELLQFIAKQLEKKHPLDPALVEKHNADPTNKDFQLDSNAPSEQSDVVHDLLAFLAEQMIELNRQKQEKMRAFLKWLEAELEVQADKKGRTGIEALTGKTKLKNYLGNYQKGEESLPFDELWVILRKNKRRIGRNLSPAFMKEAEQAYNESLSALLPVKERLRLTDELIDQIVYCLYGLTEEEIQTVEKQPIK